LEIYNRKKVVMICLTLIILGIILLLFASSLKIFIPAAVLLGMGWAFLYPFLTIHVIENAGLARGPAMATFTAFGDLGAGVGPMIMGSILERASYPIMFGCLILTGCFNLLYFYLVIGKRVERVSEEISWIPVPKD